MGFFNWAAPLIRRCGDRFDSSDATVIAGWLRPAVSPGGRLLDVGGGAGQLAHLLAVKLDAHATVVDPTPEMLDHVLLDDRVSAVAGTAEALPFADSSFDALVVTDAFHHFRDQRGAVREFARVVRNGGIVVVLDLDSRPVVMRLVAIAERLVGEPAGFMSPEEMCEFMAHQGINGACGLEQGASYHFIGTVEKSEAA